MTIEEMWQGYAAAVQVPMGGVQWKESRRAFYAGATALLSELRRMPDDEDDGIRRLSSWEKECHGFYKALAAGAR